MVVVMFTVSRNLNKKLQGNPTDVEPCGYQERCGVSEELASPVETQCHVFVFVAGYLVILSVLY